MSDITFSESLDSECENEIYAFDQGLHDDVVDAFEMAMTPLFPELSSDWSGDRSSGQYWGRGRLPHEIENPKLIHQDGSYDQITAGEDGQETLGTFNPDGTKFDEDWHCEIIGSEVVVYDNGVEVSRHPRAMWPILEAQRKERYLEKYGGRKTK